MKRIFTGIISFVIALYANADPWDSDSIAQILSGRVLEPIEGLWQWPDDGTLALISRSSESTFDLIVIDSPRLDIAPGTVMGRAVSTPKVNVYDARIYSGSGEKSTKCTITTVASGSRLAFEGYREGKRVSLWRWLPYVFRITVRDNAGRPKGLEGPSKLYPKDYKTHKPCL